MKFAFEPTCADPDAAARNIVDLAAGIEPVQDSRIYIDLVSAPFLKAGGTGDEFRAGIAHAVEWRLLRQLPSSVGGAILNFRNRISARKKG